ncbi:MAG: hypothetical protein GYB30_05935 [Gammaproteobacteria bacterium]|jgi:hypothetical protein|nr:hypothetical protein [Gammaproteobacteria bacterium]
MKLLVVFASAFLAVGCASSGVDKNDPISQVNKADESHHADVVATDGEQKYICTQEQEIGTRFRTRVCRTPEQIEQERREAEEALRNASPAVSVSSGGN